MTRITLIIAAVLALAIPASASAELPATRAPVATVASNFVATRSAVERWISTHWNNVDSVRCYGREYDRSLHGRRYYGWFSCASSFYNDVDIWSEVAEVTPSSRYGFRYHRVRTFTN